MHCTCMKLPGMHIQLQTQDRHHSPSHSLIMATHHRVEYNCIG